MGTRMLMLAQQLVTADTNGVPTIPRDMHLTGQCDLLRYSLNAVQASNVIQCTSGLDFVGKLEEITAGLAYLAHVAHAPFHAAAWMHNLRVGLTCTTVVRSCSPMAQRCEADRLDPWGCVP